MGCGGSVVKDWPLKIGKSHLEVLGQYNMWELAERRENRPRVLGGGYRGLQPANPEGVPPVAILTRFLTAEPFRANYSPHLVNV
jgi:hypothetical protein